MLPFMREEGFKESPMEPRPSEGQGATEKGAGSATGEKAPQQRHGQGGGKMGQSRGGQSQSRSSEGRDEQYLTVAVHGNSVRKTTILLAILFCLGLLCLWFMIKQSTPSAGVAAVNTEETQLKKAIIELIGVKSEIFSRMDEIVKKFYEFSDVQQVKVNELAKNPFKLEMFLGNTDEIGIDIELLRQQQLKEQAMGMQLLSIMQSNTDKGSCCMIDDKILYEGDKIRGFEVRQISDSTVSLVLLLEKGGGLESEGLEIVLKLSE